MTLAIRGGRTLLEDGSFAEAELLVEDGLIAAVGDGTAADVEIDARGLLVLPGIVDVHGDGFEHQIAPRPSAAFALDIAMRATDRQLIANGVTTAFLAQGYSWEGGVRGGDQAGALLAWLAAGRERLACDMRMQIRYEVYHVDGLARMLDWMRAGQVDMLVLNDHLPEYEERIDDDGRLLHWAQKAGCDVAEFRSRIRAARDRAAEAPGVLVRLCGEAVACDIALGSHDDRTPEIRRGYHELGAHLAEFPLSLETAREARRLGNPIVMGAPNVLRGGSSVGNAGAAELVCDGACTALCSDYYIPSLLHAPFHLVATAGLGLAAAWPLVSDGPARAAGLADRGALAAGRRADIVLLEESGAQPILHATIAAGRIAYAGTGLMERLRR